MYGRSSGRPMPKCGGLRHGFPKFLLRRMREKASSLAWKKGNDCNLRPAAGGSKGRRFHPVKNDRFSRPTAQTAGLFIFAVEDVACVQESSVAGEALSRCAAAFWQVFNGLIFKYSAYSSFLCGAAMKTRKAAKKAKEIICCGRQFML